MVTVVDHLSARNHHPGSLFYRASSAGGLETVILSRRTNNIRYLLELASCVSG